MKQFAPKLLPFCRLQLEDELTLAMKRDMHDRALELLPSVVTAVSTMHDTRCLIACRGVEVLIIV